MMNRALLYGILKNKSGAEISASGNPITLSGTLADNPLKDCKIYGWSKQDGDPTPENPVEIESAGMKMSTGKNLFTGFVFGGTNPKNENGITTTKEGALYIRSDYIPCEVGKHYVYNIPEGWRESQTVFCDSGKKYIGTPGITTPMKSFTAPENTAYFAFQIAKMDTVPIYQSDLEAVSKLVQVEQADACTEYEPYTGGVPKLYGDKIDLEVHGKNLIDFTKDSDVLGLYRAWKAPKKDDEYVTVTLFDNDVTVDISGIYFGFLSDGVSPNTVIWMVDNGIINIREFKDKSRYLSIYPIDAMEKFLQRFKILVEIGAKSTDYEPYYELQPLSISTPIGLPAIPVATGGNYTDANGQHWVADYIDLARGKYVQRVWIGKIDETASMGVYDVMRGFFARNILPDSCYRREGFVNQQKDFFIGSLNKYLYINNSEFYDEDADDKGLSNWKAHLAEHPLTVMTYLNEPIERNLTTAEIQAYQNLVTYGGTTILENDADCYMEVTAGGGDALRAKKLALILGD